jgi:hypothetical protein
MWMITDRLLWLIKSITWNTDVYKVYETAIKAKKENDLEWLSEKLEKGDVKDLKDVQKILDKTLDVSREVSEINKFRTDKDKSSSEWDIKTINEKLWKIDQYLANDTIPDETKKVLETQKTKLQSELTEAENTVNPKEEKKEEIVPWYEWKKIPWVDIKEIDKEEKMNSDVEIPEMEDEEIKVEDKKTKEVVTEKETKKPKETKEDKVVLWEVSKELPEWVLPFKVFQDEFGMRWSSDNRDRLDKIISETWTELKWKPWSAERNIWLTNVLLKLKTDYGKQFENIKWQMWWIWKEDWLAL